MTASVAPTGGASPANVTGARCAAAERAEAQLRAARTGIVACAGLALAAVALCAFLGLATLVRAWWRRRRSRRSGRYDVELRDLGGGHRSGRDRGESGPSKPSSETAFLAGPGGVADGSRGADSDPPPPPSPPPPPPLPPRPPRAYAPDPFVGFDATYEDSGGYGHLRLGGEPVYAHAE